MSVVLQGSGRVCGLLGDRRDIHVHSERSKRCGDHTKLFLLERPTLSSDGEGYLKYTLFHQDGLFFTISPCYVGKLYACANDRNSLAF